MKGSEFSGGKKNEKLLQKSRFKLATEKQFISVYIRDLSLFLSNLRPFAWMDVKIFHM